MIEGDSALILCVALACLQPSITPGAGDLAGLDRQRSGSDYGATNKKR